jgi:hypothetical protein
MFKNEKSIDECPERTFFLAGFLSRMNSNTLIKTERRIGLFFIPTKVNIGGLKINSPDHISAVSVGSNMKIGINVSGKKNQGFGQQMADCSVTAVPINLVLDHDFLDSPSMKNNAFPKGVI